MLSLPRPSSRCPVVTPSSGRRGARTSSPWVGSRALARWRGRGRAAGTGTAPWRAASIRAGPAVLTQSFPRLPLLVDPHRLLVHLRPDPPLDLDRVPLALPPARPIDTIHRRLNSPTSSACTARASTTSASRSSARPSRSRAPTSSRSASASASSPRRRSSASTSPPSTSWVATPSTRLARLGPLLLRLEPYARALLVRARPCRRATNVRASSYPSCSTARPCKDASHPLCTH